MLHWASSSQTSVLPLNCFFLPSMMASKDLSDKISSKIRWLKMKIRVLEKTGRWAGRKGWTTNQKYGTDYYMVYIIYRLYERIKCLELSWRSADWYRSCLFFICLRKVYHLVFGFSLSGRTLMFPFSSYVSPHLANMCFNKMNCFPLVLRISYCVQWSMIISSPPLKWFLVTYCYIHRMVHLSNPPKRNFFLQ